MGESFGAWLRRARKAANLTQRQLAESVGVDHTYLSKIENGARYSTTSAPSEATIRALALACGVGENEAVIRAGKLPEVMLADLLALDPASVLEVWSEVRRRADEVQP